MNLKNGVLLGLALTTVFSVGIAVGAQPHMQNALQSLEGAKSQLAKADHNKGGHRVRAIELINQAIAEVNLGINAVGK